MSFINIRGQLLDLSVPRIMGILNITPDSFYPGSRTSEPDAIFSRAKKMVEAGVDIVDIGGYSSRPGASPVTEDIEMERVKSGLEIVRNSFPETIVSVDTFRSSIAKMAREIYKVDIINDISGGMADPKMAGFIATTNTPYIIMHMQGTPDTMQLNPTYDNVVEDLLKWFSRQLSSLRLKGVKDIIIDPGFGFGKSSAHNWSLLRNLDRFSILGCPIMAGLSRKSMIWKELGETSDSDSALVGTVALNSLALFKGASIIRVHDVSEAAITILLIQRVLGTD